MITTFTEWLHNRLLSLWGSTGAWAGTAYTAVYGGMEPITAISATLAVALTAITIRDKLNRHRDVQMLRDVFRAAEETGNDSLRELAAGMLQQKSERKRKRPNGQERRGQSPFVQRDGD